MAKKKQKPEIGLEGFDDIDFNKKPDIEAAKSVIKKPAPLKETKIEEKKETKQTQKGTFPAVGKKRTSFNLDANLHKALKDYCYFEDIDMVEYVFEQLVKPDLEEKGYYPPKKKKR